MTTSPSDQHVPQLLFEGTKATITLCAPVQANRLRPVDLPVLRDHLAAVNADENVLVLRIVSQGKYFCSGYDIDSFSDHDSGGTNEFGEVVDLLEAARPVTIAVVQGGLYGGGTDLALACDFRIGSSLANMFMPATKLGLHLYAGGLRRYVNRLGIDQAKRLMLTAESLDADEMRNIGFLTDLVLPEALDASVQELTQTLCAMAPRVLIEVKKCLNDMAYGRYDYEGIAEAVYRSERSADLREGVAAWREKRPAKFSGR